MCEIGGQRANKVNTHFSPKTGCCVLHLSLWNFNFDPTWPFKLGYMFNE